MDGRPYTSLLDDPTYFIIGGDSASRFQPLIKDVIDDFIFIQNTFLKTVRWI